jgi:hypothetical protein
MRDESSSFPWRPLAALLLALAAQALLESPVYEYAALYLFALALLLLFWPSLHPVWPLPSPPPYLLTFNLYPLPRVLPLLASLSLLAAAFYFFGGNQFTWLNLALWLAGLAFFLRAFWVRRKNPYTDYTETSRTDKHGFSFLKKIREIREIRVLPFIFIILLAALFRFYHLSQLPAEPFSDHAEKILDLYDITQGQAPIFFPRNTGREAIQFYWSLLVAALFQTGLTFQTLKIGTALLGFLTLPFIYLLGTEIANRRAGLLAMLFAGIAYWPNVISRIGLRFPLYPLFVAPTFYFLLRGLRTNNRNDFILSGLFLGLGLHGYSPFRVAPVLVLVTVALWWLYTRRQVGRYTGKQVAVNMAILASAAFIVFLPLARYGLERPNDFWFRAETRLVAENPLPIFFSNLGNGLLMFNVDDGNTLVVSLVDRPALDIVTGGLFLIGIVLLLRRRSFLDLWLVAAILTLILPSVLSLAYPEENPALNRAGGALVPVFAAVGMTLDGLLTRLEGGLNRAGRAVIIAGVTGLLFAASALQNYDLVFRQFDEQYDRAVWRTSEMGEVVREFGSPDGVWIVSYPHWVDTRLPAVWAGYPNRDFAIQGEELASTLQLPGPKLFIFKASPLAAGFEDAAAKEELRRLYPQGELTLHESEPWWQSFWVYFVPAP